jgi:LysM repeat protein
MVTIKKNAAFAYYKEAANHAAPDFTNVAGTRLRLLRLVSEDLNTRFERAESNEVRGDAQSSGSTISGASGAGNIQLQYSLDTYDDWLAGLLYAADVNDAGTGREDGWLQGGFTALAAILASPASVTFDVSDGSFNTAAAFSRAPAAGERIVVRGFGNKNLDTVWVVKTGATTSKIAVENDTGAASVAEYAGLTANLVASATVLPVKGYTRNGTFERNFGCVRMYSDSEPAGVAGTSGLSACDWALFRGVIPTGIQLACAPGQAGWTGTIPCLLVDETPITNATSASNIGGFQITNWDEVEVVNTNPLANAIQSVLMVRVRKVGAAVTTAIRHDPLGFNINVSNGASEIAATRNRGAIAINLGTFAVSIALELVYESAAWHSSMLADEAWEIEIAVGDSNGLAQLWRFPKCKFTSERPNPGKGAAIVQRLAFTAEAGGQGFVGGATAGRMVEVLSFYTRAA